MREWLHSGSRNVTSTARPSRAVTRSSPSFARSAREAGSAHSRRLASPAKLAKLDATRLAVSCRDHAVSKHASGRDIPTRREELLWNVHATGCA